MTFLSVYQSYVSMIRYSLSSLGGRFPLDFIYIYMAFKLDIETPTLSICLENLTLRGRGLQTDASGIKIVVRNHQL